MTTALMLHPGEKQRQRDEAIRKFVAEELHEDLRWCISFSEKLPCACTSEDCCFRCEVIGTLRNLESKAGALING